MLYFNTHSKKKQEIGMCFVIWDGDCAKCTKDICKNNRRIRKI